LISVAVGIARASLESSGLDRSRDSLHDATAAGYGRRPVDVWTSSRVVGDCHMG
jgi:hypothetical protein